MSIANITTCLQSVNSILLRIDGRLTFDEALVLSEFYRDYSDTNNLIEAVEKEVAEDADRLLSDTFSLLSEIEKFLSIGIAGIQSVNYEQLFEEHVKPFEERYESAKAVSTRQWQKYSAISSRLDFLLPDSDENKRYRKAIDNAIENARRLTILP